MNSEYSNCLRELKPTFDHEQLNFECEQNKYSDLNPGGYVNLGSAQNFAATAELAERLDSLRWSSEDARHHNFAGTKNCLEAIADHLQVFSDRQIQASNIVVGNGIASLLEALIFATTQPGDAVITTTPIDPSFVNAMRLRTQIKLIAIETQPETQFHMTPAVLNEKLQEMSSQQKNVKAVVICSPGNPIGHVYTPVEIIEFVKLAERFNLWLIVDEICALSCFENVDFFSSLKICSDKVLTVGGLSKDFSDSGYSAAWLHTSTSQIIQSLHLQAQLFQSPVQMQRAIESFLEPQWHTRFLAHNRTRLTKQYGQTIEAFYEIGAKLTPIQAGLSAWLDLRAFLKSKNESGQLELYRYLLHQHRVHISPSSVFLHDKPGFFKINFNQESGTLQEGLKRIQQGMRHFRLSTTNHFRSLKNTNRQKVH